MSWGSGSWGAGSPWGTGSTVPPPTLIQAQPNIVERRGGTVVTFFGTNFAYPVTVEILQGGIAIAEGYIFDPEFDIKPNKIFVGMPILPDGTYDVRVTTDGGSATLASAITAKLHADEYRLIANRSKWAHPWQVGERLL